MNVCANTRGWPSTDLLGVDAGFPAGPFPCITVPDTVTSSEGGWLPMNTVSGAANERAYQTHLG